VDLLPVLLFPFSGDERKRPPRPPRFAPHTFFTRPPPFSSQVREARPLLEDVEAERMFPPEQLIKEAITATEQDGIVFIDEVGAGGEQTTGQLPGREEECVLRTCRCGCSPGRRWVGFT
jgi:hypothetical protein